MRHAARMLLATGALSLASCASVTPDLHTEAATMGKKAVSQIGERPVQSLTGFTDGLRCIDNQMIDYGIRNLSIIVEDLDDATKKVAAGTKDMLISALSTASRRSRAIRLVAFGNDARNTASFMDRAQRTSSYQAVPDLSIRGSITQFDDNVAKRTADAGFSIGSFLSGGVGSSATAKVVGLDMAMVRTGDFSVISGVTSKNAVVLMQSGTGVDASAAIRKFGATYQTNTSMSEGTAVGLRNLVELATIELIGKLNKLPYWRCLGAKDSDAEVKSEIADWLEGMIQSEISYEGLSQPLRSAELFGYFQQQMAALGLYDGRTDGLPTKDFGAMLSVYRTMLGLPAGTDMNQELMERHYAADRGPLREKIAKYVADNPREPPPPPAAAAPQAAQAGAAPSAAASEPVRTASAAPAAPAPAQPAPAQPTAAAAAGAGIALGFNQAENARFRPGTSIDLRIVANSPALLYCFLRDEAGAIVRLLPNSSIRAVQAAPGQPVPLAGQIGKNKWEIVSASSGAPETVACFASAQNLTARVPQMLQGGDFQPIQTTNRLEDVRDALRQAAGSQFGEAWYTIRSR